MFIRHLSLSADCVGGRARRENALSSFREAIGNECWSFPESIRVSSDRKTCLRIPQTRRVRGFVIPFQWLGTEQSAPTPTYLGRYFVDAEGPQEPTVADRRCTLHHPGSLGTDLAVQVTPLVEVRSGEVQLAKVPRVVHVEEKRVHVRGGADA